MTSKDPTFAKYTPEQARKYGKERTSYSTGLYDCILSHHTDTGGNFDLLLDVGCGPGNATRDLAPQFKHAIGLDPGESMISAANALGTGENIRFEVGPAELCDQVAGLVPQSVDLITAAMAAHWFDMAKFWKAAARALKPGGTVALWTCSSLFCHPKTQNAGRVQEILFHLERDLLGPYELPGNRMSRTMYEELPLPWTISPQIQDFPSSSFVRQEWDRDGVLSAGLEGDFLGGSSEQTLESLEASLSTASMVTRWREANPKLVGTSEDCVAVTMSALRDALGSDRFRNGPATVLLMVKKKN